MAFAAVGVGALAAAAIYGGLAFVPASAGLTTNMSAALGAGIGIAGGVVVGMLGAPEIGVGIAGAGLGVAAAQFATAEVASYQAGNPAQTGEPTSNATTSGINALTEAIPLHTNSELQGAASRLRSLRMR